MVPDTYKMLRNIFRMNCSYTFPKESTKFKTSIGVSFQIGSSLLLPNQHQLKRLFVGVLKAIKLYPLLILNEHLRKKIENK